jgi:hypothetical protein
LDLAVLAADQMLMALVVVILFSQLLLQLGAEEVLGLIAVVVLVDQAEVLVQVVFQHLVEQEQQIKVMLVALTVVLLIMLVVAVALEQ